MKWKWNLTFRSMDHCSVRDNRQSFELSYHNTLVLSCSYRVYQRSLKPDVTFSSTATKFGLIDDNWPRQQEGLRDRYIQHELKDIYNKSQCQSWEWVRYYMSDTLFKTLVEVAGTSSAQPLCRDSCHTDIRAKCERLEQFGSRLDLKIWSWDDQKDSMGPGVVGLSGLLGDQLRSDSKSPLSAGFVFHGFQSKPSCSSIPSLPVRLLIKSYFGW